MKRAIITRSENGRCEARCRNCGKLLFVFEKKSEKKLTVSHVHLIIVSRCTRSNCKTDNEVII